MQLEVKNHYFYTVWSHTTLHNVRIRYTAQIECMIHLQELSPPRQLLRQDSWDSDPRLCREA